MGIYQLGQPEIAGDFSEHGKVQERLEIAFCLLGGGKNSAGMMQTSV